MADKNLLIWPFSKTVVARRLVAAERGNCPTGGQHGYAISVWAETGYAGAIDASTATSGHRPLSPRAESTNQ